MKKLSSDQASDVMHLFFLATSLTAVLDKVLLFIYYLAPGSILISRMLASVNGLCLIMLDYAGLCWITREISGGSAFLDAFIHFLNVLDFH